MDNIERSAVAVLRGQGVVLVTLLLCCVPCMVGQTVVQSTGFEGVITLAPSRPGPAREGASGSVPLAGTTFLVEKDGRAVTSFVTNAEGAFRVLLEAGHYTVALKDRKNSPGKFGPWEIDVAPEKITKVEWRCDSGMR